MEQEIQRVSANHCYRSFQELCHNFPAPQAKIFVCIAACLSVVCIFVFALIYANLSYNYKCFSLTKQPYSLTPYYLAIMYLTRTTHVVVF